MKKTLFLYGIVCLGIHLCAAPSFPAVDTPVKLYVTYQETNYSSPWQKKKAASRSGYGCILPSRKILTTADIVKDATMIKVEKNTEKKYYPGKIEAIDYDADLAVLTVDDDSFFNDLKPVELEEKVRIDQPVKFLVFEESDNIRAIPGEIVKVSVEQYYLGLDSFLAYGAAVNFEDRGGGWSEPVFADGKLVGLTMSYNSKEQYATIIPSSIIRHFLEASSGGRYRGFPFHGFAGSAVRDPVFRKFLRLPPDVGGLYIHTIFPGGSAAGTLKEGDVLLSVAGHAIDADGYYRDTLWGRLDYRDLFSRFHYPGDTVEVEIFRDGTILRLPIEMKRWVRSDYLIPPYSCGTPTKYLIVGGLILQELTADYLKEWGPNWQTAANKKFLYHYFYNSRHRRPGRERIVILNRLLPDGINLGYQRMEDMVVSKVNGRPIGKLEDVVEALGHPERGFHRFIMEEFNREIILPVDSLPEADRRIGTQYGIDEMRRINQDTGSAFR